MKIFYNQSQLNRTLILGIAFLVIGLLSLFTTASIYLAGIGGIGIVHIGTYFFYKNRAFIVFSDDAITINSLFKKQIALRDIRSVKYFAGDYTIKSAKGETVIDTNLVDKASLPELKNHLYNLVHGAQTASSN